MPAHKPLPQTSPEPAASLAPRATLVAGALLASTLVTALPGATLLMYEASDGHLFQWTVIGVEALLVAWAAPAGAFIVRARFSERPMVDVWCVPWLSVLVLLSGAVWTVGMGLEAGSMLPEAILTFGLITLGLSVLALFIGAGVWLLTRTMADQLVVLASAPDPEGNSSGRIARRIGLWLFAAAGTHSLLKMIGGPLVFGVVGALGSAWFLLAAVRARTGTSRRWIAGALLLALIAAGIQSCFATG